MTKIPIQDFPSTLGPACAPPLKAGENYNPEFDADYEAGVCRRSLSQTHVGCERLRVACMISVSAESKRPSTTIRPGSCFLPLGEKFRISLSAQAVIPTESTTVSLNSISRLCFIWLLEGGGRCVYTRLYFCQRLLCERTHMGCYAAPPFYILTYKHTSCNIQAPTMPRGVPGRLRASLKFLPGTIVGALVTYVPLYLDPRYYFPNPHARMRVASCRTASRTSWGSS